MRTKAQKILCRHRWLWTFILVIGVIILCRVPILRGFYNFLNVSEYPTMTYDYGLVLGGEPLDRTGAAADLYLDQKVKKIICTGNHVPPELAAIDMMITEAELSKRRLIGLGVAEADIILLEEATSTKEEVDAINEYFKDEDRASLIIITTQSHTRRALRVFKKHADPWKEMSAYGVSPSLYEADIWWTNEFGVIAVFNEYLKTVFYWIAY